MAGLPYFLPVSALLLCYRACHEASLEYYERCIMTISDELSEEDQLLLRDACYTASMQEHTLCIDSCLAPTPLGLPRSIIIASVPNEPVIAVSFKMPSGAIETQLRLSPSGRTFTARSPYKFAVKRGTYTVSLRSVYKSGYSEWADTVVEV